MQIGISGYISLQRFDHLGEHDVAGVGAGAAARLQDHRRVDRGRRFHDRQALLHVVDVESRHAVAVFGGVIEQLSEGDAGHLLRLSVLRVCDDAVALRAARATALRR